MTRQPLPALAEFPAFVQWAMLISAGLLGTFVLNSAALPAALLVGPVIASTAFGVAGATVRIPTLLHRFGQGTAGCLVGQYLTGTMVEGIVQIWPAVLVFSTLTLLVACLVGWGLGAFGTVDRETAIWGFLPGMAGTVIAMSHERGLDSRLVAFIQLARVIAVVMLMSALLRATSADATLIEPPGGEESALGLLLTFGAIACGLLSARFLPVIPAAAMMVPMVLSATLQASGLGEVALPVWLLVAAYLILGSQVGLRFTPEMLRNVARSFWPVLGGIVLLMVLCAFCGAALSLIAGESLVTGVLATVPGSIETVALLAISSGADVGFVMTLQVVRLFAVILIGPFLASWLCEWSATRPE